MSFSRMFAIACASSTIFSIAVGAAMLGSETIEVHPSSGLQQPFLPSDKGHALISGHSLTDRPFPDYLSEIAGNAGIPISWKMQHASGSSIGQRLAGKFPRLDTRPYDLLIITEQHGLLDSLAWHDTVSALYRFHSDFIAANPAGTSYFYTPWISLTDRRDPVGWIDYERQALPVWRCVVERVNAEIAAAGRPDRVRFIPTSLALAELVERLMSDPAFNGFEDQDGAARMDAIFADTVHLTPLGAYYVAAVSFATIYGRGMDELSPPRMFDATQASALRTFAAEFVRNYRARASSDAGDCAKPVPLAFVLQYMSYTVQIRRPDERSRLMAQLHRLKNTIHFAWRFRNGLG
ncbi:hypothetical protein [Rhizobium sp. LC145]|uniref:hypothetical protein n=1 Tax=Rhizobium sp. LC145 TaxID=1120688 RepID=UPI000A7B99D9|nr:hypothetical protein [Rhizobium sp. LC145]TKT68520.1 hypothetical protein FDR95_03035 [Rhizobiaceae bacterium LC148]